MPRRPFPSLALGFLLLAGARAQPSGPAPATPDPAAPSTSAAPASQPASVVRDLVTTASPHWSFAVPGGWTLAPKSTADAIDAAMSRLLPDKGFRCVAVVWADPARETRGPNIQVQFAPADNRTTTLDQIEQTLTNAREIAAQRQRERQAAGNLVSSADETPPILDRERHRITSSGSITLPPDAANPATPPQVIRFISTGMIGRDGVTRLILYAPADQFDACLPLYAEATETFAYDPGFQYAPPSAQLALTTLFRRSGLTILAVIAIIVALRLITRKKSAARRA